MKTGTVAIVNIVFLLVMSLYGFRVASKYRSRFLYYVAFIVSAGFVIRIAEVVMRAAMPQYSAWWLLISGTMGAFAFVASITLIFLHFRTGR